MQLKEAFDFMKTGKTCCIEGTKYRLISQYPPKLESREIGHDEWYPVDSSGYFLYYLASDLWEISSENN